MKRTRGNNKPDLFVESNKGRNIFDVLNEFLDGREEYVRKHYSEDHQIVLFELNLYRKTLNRLRKI